MGAKWLGLMATDCLMARNDGFRPRAAGRPIRDEYPLLYGKRTFAVCRSWIATGLEIGSKHSVIEHPLICNIKDVATLGNTDQYSMAVD